MTEPTEATDAEQLNIAELITLLAMSVGGMGGFHYYAVPEVFKVVSQSTSLTLFALGTFVFLVGVHYLEAQTGA